MSALWLHVGVPTVVTILAVAALGLFVLASLVGRWPLWLAGFLVAVAALLVAYLAPQTPPRPDRAAPDERPARVSAWPTDGMVAILRTAPICGGQINHPHGTEGRALSSGDPGRVPGRDASRRENPRTQKGPWRATS